MRIRHSILASLLAGALLAGCRDLEVTNPNQQNSASYWQNASDANRGVTAAYNALLFLGTYSRWHIFANDIRSDIGTARTSPWGDLANFNAFQLNDYNFEINRHLWAHNYELVGRANQVIANVPGIEMDATERARLVGEAKFLRALGYYNLVTLYENVPLVTAPLSPAERPASATPTQTWAQIEQDLKDAAAVLPTEYPGTGDRGRATKGAALAMLGKAQLQMAGVLDLQAKWGEAATSLAQVVALPRYSLLPNYADNFTESRDFSNPESVFEVSTEDQFPVGVTGISFPKMIGPCYRPGGTGAEFNPTFCDGRPTRWYFEQFQASRTATGGIDPRMDVTLLYDRPAADAEMVFGRTRGSFFDNVAGSPVRADTMLFFRKYAEWQSRTDQRWDNPVNYKVVRFADVLLMQAEALNESGGTNPTGPLNLVRARVGKAPVLATLTRAQLRDTILHERMFELGLEASRFNDLRRHDLLSPALASRDWDFTTFVVGKSERLPIPTTERNLNPNVPQNPQW
jgi:hypothetical protein